MNRRNLGWAAILLILPLLAGCSDDDNTTIMAPEAGVAIARVAHLSPDAPPVDVWVDGEVALSNVAFRGVSPYLELAEGEYRVQVTPTGRSTPVVIDEMLTLAGETAYTVAAQGLLTGISANVLVDDRVPSASSAEVRFVHTSPDAPPVDVTLTDGTVLFGNVAFGGSLSGPVAAGTYDLQVRLAGTETVVLSFGDVTLGAGTNYTIFAIGLAGDGSLAALPVIDTP